MRTRWIVCGLRLRSRRACPLGFRGLFSLGSLGQRDVKACVLPHPLSRAGLADLVWAGRTGGLVLGEGS